nr:TRAP transporter large permease subunit [Amycolatopsis sp. WAC 04182]
MNAILALVAFIAAIVVWNAVFKRNIGEAMAVGFLVTAAFAGTDFFAVAWESLIDGLKSEITFAALAFVFVSELLTRTGLVQRMVDILSSFLGRRRGDPPTPRPSPPDCSARWPTTVPLSSRPSDRSSSPG